MKEHNKLKVALAQLAPVWLDREATLKKVCDAIDEAARNSAGPVSYTHLTLPTN